MLDPLQIRELTATSKVRELLRRFTYKPGWRFKIAGDYEDPPRPPGPGAIQVTFQAPDAYHPKRVVPIISVIAIPDQPEDEDRLARWLFDRILDIERHEAGEWFVIDGRRPFDPHR
jgi:hypothetical protein